MMISRMSQTSQEQYVFTGNSTRVQVVIFSGLLDCILVQEIFWNRKCGVHTLIRRNLIYVPILDRLGYSFLFGTGKANLYRDSLLISNGTLCGNLYRLELYNLLSFSLIVNSISSTKRLRLNEKSFIL